MTTRLFYIKCSWSRLLLVRRYLNKYWISYLRRWKECVGQVPVSCENSGCENAGGGGGGREWYEDPKRAPNGTPGVPGVPRGLFSIAVSPRVPVHPGAGRSRMSYIFSDRSTACGAPPRRFDTARNKMFIEPPDRNRFPRV